LGRGPIADPPGSIRRSGRRVGVVAMLPGEPDDPPASQPVARSSVAAAFLVFFGPVTYRGREKRPLPAARNSRASGLDVRQRKSHIVNGHCFGAFRWTGAGVTHLTLVAARGPR
jgi:hypothetical protein